MLKVQNRQSHQPSKQSHVENKPKQTSGISGNIIAEEQTDFRAGRSTTEQIFNMQILKENHTQHQHLYHVFMDFTNAFDRV